MHPASRAFVFGVVGFSVACSLLGCVSRGGKHDGNARDDPASTSAGNPPRTPASTGADAGTGTSAGADESTAKSTAESTAVRQDFAGLTIEYETFCKIEGREHDAACLKQSLAKLAELKPWNSNEQYQVYFAIQNLNRHLAEATKLDERFDLNQKTVSNIVDNLNVFCISFCRNIVTANEESFELHEKAEDFIYQLENVYDDLRPVHGKQNAFALAKKISDLALPDPDTPMSETACTIAVDAVGGCGGGTSQVQTSATTSVASAASKQNLVPPVGGAGTSAVANEATAKTDTPAVRQDVAGLTKEIRNLCKNEGKEYDSACLKQSLAKLGELKPWNSIEQKQIDFAVADLNRDLAEATKLDEMFDMDRNKVNNIIVNLNHFCISFCKNIGTASTGDEYYEQDEKAEAFTKQLEAVKDELRKVPEKDEAMAVVMKMRKVAFRGMGNEIITEAVCETAVGGCGGSTSQVQTFVL